MACYHPLSAYKSFKPTSGGKSHIVFKKPPDAHMYQSIELPCGQCVGCRIQRARHWSTRCMHEASQYENNCFITLTYNEENLPLDGSVHVEHFQKFMKKLRRRFVPKNPHCKSTQPELYEKFKDKHAIRFFHCGEYGENLSRPHYHAILFNFEFPDKTPFSQQQNKITYTSEILEEMWGKGFCIIGSVTEQSCNYVARYIMKKINGDQKESHYERINPYTGEIHNLNPEYITMSRKPGIGKKWYDRYKQEVFPADEVIVKRGEKNVPVKPPPYYDSLYEIDNPVYHAHIKKQRMEKAKENKTENTPERLAVKEKLTKANLAQHTRKIH